MIPDYVRGAMAPVFTAFREDGAFDPDGQRAFLDFLLGWGPISAFIVRSGLGQMYAFGYDDVIAIAETTCRHLAGKAPVIVGCAGVWDRNRDRYPDPATYTRQAVELSRRAEALGAAGVLHVVPEAVRPRDGETIGQVILRYFAAVNDAVRTPIFIYQPPGTDPGYRITTEWVRVLAQMDNVAGMKTSTADAGYITDMIWATADLDFAFIPGAETAFLAALALGSRATIGQGCTVNPSIVAAVQQRFEAGDLRGALDAQRSVNLLVESCPNPVEFLKRYAAEKGYAVQPHARSVGSNPYQRDRDPLTAEEYAGFKKVLERELARFA